MEHAFTSRYINSVQMPMKEDDGFTRKLTNAGRLNKFHIINQQENHFQATQFEHCYSSDAGAFISGSTNDLPEALPLLRSHTVDNVSFAANLQGSPDKLIQTTEDKTKVKELCYTDIGFPRTFLFEQEYNAGLTPLVSLKSGGFPEVCKSETYTRLFGGHSSRQTEELSARKNRDTKDNYDESSKYQVNQGHVSFRQNNIGPWNHIYNLAASVGSFRVHNEKSTEETVHSTQIPSFQDSNLDLQEQVGDKQNEHDYHAKMMQYYSETTNQQKLKVGLPQNSCRSKQPLHNFHATVHDISYHGPSLTSKPVTQISEGIRTKILSSTCSSQFFVKDSLNDNRSATARQVTVHSNDSVSEGRNQKSETQSYVCYGEGNCQPIGTSIAYASKLNQHGSIEMNDGTLENGLTLRKWLSQTSRVGDKIENLHVFKQILELVEHAHSQGIFLRNIRPSYFMLSSLNRIIFLESPPTQSGFEFFKYPEYSLSNPVMHSLELHQNRKRSRQYLTTDAIDGHSHGNMFQLLNQMTRPSDKDNLQCECNNIGVGASIQKQGSASSIRSSSVKVCIGRACELFSVDPGTEDNVDGKLLSINAESPRNNLGEGQRQVIEQTGGQCQSRLGAFAGKDLLLLEENWYTSPEELNGGTKTFSSDIYGLGVLLFELFSTFTSWEEQIRAMSDLRHRILPSHFLSEYPREAGFCLWLLHPEPCSRPKARDIVQSELLNEDQDALAERQAVVGVDEEDTETELLLDFLLCLQKQKQERACKLAQDVSCLTKDIEEVEKRRSFSISSVPLVTVQIDSAIPNKNALARDIINKSENCFNQGEEKLKSDRKLIYQQPSRGGAEQGVLHLETNPSRTDALTCKGARLMKNFKHLEHDYFSMRGKIEPSEIDCTNSSRHGQNIPNKIYSINALNRDATKLRDGEYDSVDRLGCFFDSVCKYARYSRFELRATLRHGDLLNTANVVCSVGFDRDQEFFATAGVSKKIKVFGCDAVLNENVDIHYPAVEMTSKSKLSSVCWNSYIKNHIASTDYDGVVQLWDASTGQKFAQYNEHQKRAWSVDFSHADPTKLSSGSDDCTVKLWSINQESSIDTIKTGANVCCVQFPPDSGNMITFGSADYKVYCYDLRNTKMPWYTLASHGKAVSYVKFIDSNTIVSASTDSTLKLWDLTEARSGGGSNSACTLTFTGHTNEKNFVGLSVADGYIACGSETNSVFAYYKSLPMPMASHKFGFVDPISGQESEDDSGQFVSSVCWRGKSQILVAANSTGNIKLLEMV